MDEQQHTMRGSHVKIIVLIWADILAAYSVWLLMTYLTDVWKVSFTRAAATVNIFTGASSVMQIGAAFLVDTLLGNYWMLFLSSVAYSIGLGFLSMSTPPVLSKATGTCSSYEKQCIGNVQEILFYISLALMAIGMAGHLVSLGSFMFEQVPEGEEGQEEEQQSTSALTIIGFFAVVLIPIISAFAIPYIKPWSVRFGIPAICTVVATLIFMSGSCSYIRKGPKGSPYVRLIRVFVASTLKIHLPLPSNSNQLYENNDLEEENLVPHTKGLRCLDKAAIISSSPPLEEQEKNRWKLCRMTEVEETKITLRMIPMWLTFIVVGLVMSIGNTFFQEQANHMNPKLGKLKIPLPVLLMFYELAQSQSAQYYYVLVSGWGQSVRKYAPAIGVGLGMLLSILCCITAAKVEERRIGVIEKHGLLDKPDETIPMTMFWLLPQFLLLGGLDGLVNEGVLCFFRDQVPPSLQGHMLIFTDAVFGAGRIGGVLSVYVANKVSERGGKAGWFRHTLNKSRLDNYYWTLAVMSSINIVLYILVAIWYAYRESAVDEEEIPEDEEGNNFEEIWSCCC
ncbi:hypothetical protein Sjap_001030 [Stephania japonica]|uniref:NPF family transporter n=1 Tax=Stephania japonica TaxID=461633 RepID=A0AAP0PSY6_9MAGN